jgi:hypothetical protein
MDVGTLLPAVGAGGASVEGSFAIELPGLLGFASRDTLREALRQRSDGRLQLDPQEAR